MSTKSFEELTPADLLNAQLGYCSDSRVMFRKVVQTKNYETETLEASMRLDSIGDKPAGERAVTIAIAQAQLEYTVYAGLYFKGLVDKEEFEQRIASNLDFVKKLGKQYGDKVDLSNLL